MTSEGAAANELQRILLHLFAPPLLSKEGFEVLRGKALRELSSLLLDFHKTKALLGQERQVSTTLMAQNRILAATIAHHQISLKDDDSQRDNKNGSLLLGEEEDCGRCRLLKAKYAEAAGDVAVLREQCKALEISLSNANRETSVLQTLSEHQLDEVAETLEGLRLQRKAAEDRANVAEQKAEEMGRIMERIVKEIAEDEQGRNDKHEEESPSRHVSVEEELLVLKSRVRRLNHLVNAKQIALVAAKKHLEQAVSSAPMDVQSIMRDRAATMIKNIELEERLRMLELTKDEKNNKANESSTWILSTAGGSSSLPWNASSPSVSIAFDNNFTSASKIESNERNYDFNDNNNNNNNKTVGVFSPSSTSSQMNDSVSSSASSPSSTLMSSMLRLAPDAQVEQRAKRAEARAAKAAREVAAIRADARNSVEYQQMAKDLAEARVKLTKLEADIMKRGDRGQLTLLHEEMKHMERAFSLEIYALKTQLEVELTRNNSLESHLRTLLPDFQQNEERVAEAVAIKANSSTPAANRALFSKSPASSSSNSKKVDVVTLLRQQLNSSSNNHHSK